METTLKERQEAYLHEPYTAKPMCANCIYYYPHYSKEGWSFGLGHCIHPRLKNRRAYDLCEHFQAKISIFRGR